MRLEDAPKVEDDGSAAEVAAEEVEEQGWCCSICHELTAPTDSLPCKECYGKLGAAEKATYGLGVLCFGCGEYTATDLHDECAWCKSRLAVEDRASDEEIMEAAADVAERQYDVEEMAGNEMTRLAEADGLIDFDEAPGPDLHSADGSWAVKERV